MLSAAASAFGLRARYAEKERYITNVLSSASNVNLSIILREILAYSQQLGIEPASAWNQQLRMAFGSRIGRLLGIQSQAFVNQFVSMDPPVTNLGDCIAFLREQHARILQDAILIENVLNGYNIGDDITSTIESLILGAEQSLAQQDDNTVQKIDQFYECDGEMSSEPQGAWVDTLALVMDSYRSARDAMDDVIIVREEQIQCLNEQLKAHKQSIEQAVSLIETAVGQGAQTFEQSILLERPRSEAWSANVLGYWDGSMTRLALSIDPVITLPQGQFAWRTNRSDVLDELGRIRALGTWSDDDVRDYLVRFGAPDEALYAGQEIESLVKRDIGPVLLRGGKVHLVRFIAHIGSRNVLGATETVRVSVDCRVGQGEWNEKVDRVQTVSLEGFDQTRVSVFVMCIDLQSLSGTVQTYWRVRGTQEFNVASYKSSSQDGANNVFADETRAVLGICGQLGIYNFGPRVRGVGLPAPTASVEHVALMSTGSVMIDAGMGPMLLSGERFDLVPQAAMGQAYSVDVLNGLSASELAFLTVSQALGTKPSGFVRVGNYVDREILVNGQSPYVFVRDGMTKTLKSRVGALTSPFMKLCIYYGWPSLVRLSGGNAPSSLSDAIQVLGKFDMVVLGAGLEETSHGDHQNTVYIVSALKQQGVIVFGYTDAASSNALGVIGDSVDKWKTSVGVQGVLFDNFGFDYGNNADRCQSIVSLARQRNVGFILNAWSPQDVFELSGIQLTGDMEYYLFESFGVNDDVVVSTNGTLSLNMLQKWKWMQDRGLLDRVLSTTTSVASVDLDEVLYKRLVSQAESSGMAGFCYATVYFGSLSATVHNYPILDEGDLVAQSDVGYGSYGYGNLYEMRRLVLAQRLYGSDTSGSNVVIDTSELDSAVSIGRDANTLSLVQAQGFFAAYEESRGSQGATGGLSQEQLAVRISTDQLASAQAQVDKLVRLTSIVELELAI